MIGAHLLYGKAIFQSLFVLLSFSHMSYSYISIVLFMLWHVTPAPLLHHFRHNFALFTVVSCRLKFPLILFLSPYSLGTIQEIRALNFIDFWIPSPLHAFACFQGIPPEGMYFQVITPPSIKDLLLRYISVIKNFADFCYISENSGNHHNICIKFNEDVHLACTFFKTVLINVITIGTFHEFAYVL